MRISKNRRGVSELPFAAFALILVIMGLGCLMFFFSIVLPLVVGGGVESTYVAQEDAAIASRQVLSILRTQDSDGVTYSKRIESAVEGENVDETKELIRSYLRTSGTCYNRFYAQHNGADHLLIENNQVTDYIMKYELPAKDGNKITVVLEVCEWR
ncbi:MAG: hypothetical protein ABIG20_02145 [archaeon]